MYSINYIRVCHMSGIKIRKEVMEFYFESKEAGTFKKSQGRLMSVANKKFLIRQTFFFPQIYRKLFCS